MALLLVILSTSLVVAIFDKSSASSANCAGDISTESYEALETRAAVGNFKVAGRRRKAGRVVP
jgi:hypothetical protein